MMTRTAPVTLLLFAAVPAMFASNMAIARWFDGRIPPMTLASLRWLIAGAILSIIIGRARPSLQVLARNAGLLAVLTVLGGVLSVAPQYAAATRTEAGHIALIFATSPLMVSFIERLVWNRALSAPVLVGSALAFAGIAVVVSRGAPGTLLALRFNPGDLLALAAVMAWAGYTALTRRADSGLSPMVQLWVLALGSGVALLPAAGAEVVTGHLPEITVATVLGVVALATVAGVGAYCAYGALIGRIGAARAAMSMYLVPLWTLAFGALFLNEPVQPYHLSAIALVLAGLGVSNLHLSRPVEARA